MKYFIQRLTVLTLIFTTLSGSSQADLATDATSDMMDKYFPNRAKAISSAAVQAFDLSYFQVDASGGAAHSQKLVLQRQVMSSFLTPTDTTVSFDEDPPLRLNSPGENLIVSPAGSPYEAQPVEVERWLIPTQAIKDRSGNKKLIKVPAYIYRLKSDRSLTVKRPGLIYIPGHSETPDGAAGITNCVYLARLGYTVLFFEPFGQAFRGEIPAWNEYLDTPATAVLLTAGVSLPGLFVQEVHRMIDFLIYHKPNLLKGIHKESESNSEQHDVDPDNIGVTGVSIGSTYSLYAALGDFRVKSIARVASINPFDPNASNIGKGIGDILPGIFNAGDQHLVQSLISPRAQAMIYPYYERKIAQWPGAWPDGVTDQRDSRLQDFHSYSPPSDPSIPDTSLQKYHTYEIYAYSQTGNQPRNLGIFVSGRPGVTNTSLDQDLEQFKMRPETRAPFWLTPDTVPDRCSLYPKTDLSDFLWFGDVSATNPFGVMNVQGLCQNGILGGHGYFPTMVEIAANWFQRTLSGGKYIPPKVPELKSYFGEPTGYLNMRSSADVYIPKHPTDVKGNFLLDANGNKITKAVLLDPVEKIFKNNSADFKGSMGPTEYAQTLIARKIKKLNADHAVSDVQNNWIPTKVNYLVNLKNLLGSTFSNFNDVFMANGGIAPVPYGIGGVANKVYNFRVSPEPGIFLRVDLYAPTAAETGRLVVLVGQTTLDVSVPSRPKITTGRQVYTHNIETETVPDNTSYNKVAYGDLTGDRTIIDTQGANPGDWVMTVDLRGQGSSKSRYELNSTFEGFFDENSAIYALQNGDTLAGLWTKDLIFAIRSLQSAAEPIGSKMRTQTVHVRGDGPSGATVALLAGAFDPRVISEVELVHLPASYYSTKLIGPPQANVITVPGSANSLGSLFDALRALGPSQSNEPDYPAGGHDFGYGLPSLYGSTSDFVEKYTNRFTALSMVPHIPGILNVADFPHIAALVAPRTLQITDPICMSYDRIPFDQKEAAFQYTINAYKASGAMNGALNISVNSPTEFGKSIPYPNNTYIPHPKDTKYSPPPAPIFIPNPSATYPDCWRAP